MKNIPNPIQTSIALAAQLAATHIFVGIVSLILGYVLLDMTNTMAALAVVSAIAALFGVLLNVNIQLTLNQLDWVLIRLLGLQPIELIRWRKRGPLSGMMKKVQLLVEKERPFIDQREQFLQQVGETAAQETRNRLARDLHDSIKQQLFSINISTAAAQNRLPNNPEQAKQLLDDVRKSTQGALVEMNALLQQLSPEPLEKVGLVQALQNQCDALSYRTGANVQVKIGALPDEELFAAGTQEAIFRIAQEALSNVARHARADNVTLRLFASPDATSAVQLDIVDDGLGFDKTAVSLGMGLTNIQNRVNELGGALDIDVAPQEGTHLSMTIPLLEIMTKKEQTMLKTDHTLNRFSLVGIGGGALLSTLLFYPFFIYLPGQILHEWRQGTAVFSLLLLLLVPFVWIAIGYFGAKQLPLFTKTQAIVSGMVASIIAGMIHFGLLGSAAGTVFSNQSYLLNGYLPAESESAGLFQLVESINGTLGVVNISFWLVLIFGALFGAIGGGLVPIQAGGQKKWAALRPMLMSLPISLMMSSAMTLFLSVAIFSLLAEQMMNTAVEVAQEGFVSQLASSNLVALPIYSALLLYFLLQGTAVFLFYRLQHGQSKAEKRDYLIQTYTIMAVTMALSFIFRTLANDPPWMMAAIGLNLLVILLFVWLTRQVERTFESKWQLGTQVAEWVLWGTAVLPTLLIFLNQLQWAGIALFLGIVVYASTNRYDKQLSEAEKEVTANNRLNHAIGSIMPANLSFVLPLIPFVSGFLGLVLITVPPIGLLLGSDLAKPVNALDQVSKLFQMHVVAIGALFAFGLIVVAIMILVLKGRTVWENRAA